MPARCGVDLICIRSLGSVGAVEAVRLGRSESNFQRAKPIGFGLPGTFSASASDLYKMYLDPKRHAAFTGGKVKISAKPGSAFSAFDGMLAGKMLWTIPDQMIVQRWRSTGWKKTDADSILVLTFTDVGTKGRIDLYHANVPEHDVHGVTDHAGGRAVLLDPFAKDVS